VSDDEISAIIGREELETAASQLIQLANQRGGQDNITATLIAFGSAAKEASNGQGGTRVAMPVITTNTKKVPDRKFLVPYTVFLSILEAILIVMVWLMLRV
jgi:serine/threonine protein phosphatase PrpC